MKVLEHLTEETIEHYRASKLSAPEWLAVQEHVGACEACRARLKEAVKADAALLSLYDQLKVEGFIHEANQEHLPGEQLAFYVDGKLDEVEREIADSHLVICQSCAGDVADLRRYQAVAGEAQAATAKGAIIAAGEAATASPLESTPEKGTGLFARGGAWLQRLFSFALFPAAGRLAPLGMAAVIAAILLAGVWLATRTKMQSGGGEVAKVETLKPAPLPVTSNEQNSRALPTIPTENRNTPTITPNIESSSTTANPGPRPSASQPQAVRPQRPSSNSSSPAGTRNDESEQVAFDPEGNPNGLESLPASVRQAVRRSINSRQAQMPRNLDAIAEGNIGVLMSGTAEATNNGVPFPLISPIGKVVRESQPTLRWRALAGAKSYTVAVVDESFRVVAQSPRLTTTTWALDKALRRGANYSWQVTASNSDGAEIISPVSPAPQAKFRVMDQDGFNEVTDLETSGVGSHLARGVIYAKAGLLDEARAEFEALVKDNPRSRLARQLLNSLEK
jgi:anti-sigma factor RsiW